MSSDAAIAIRGLVIDRGGRHVVHDLDVDIRRAGVTGLVGPSGCGKTTLLRAIVGVQRLAGGTITVLGATAGGGDLRRRVAYVTQSPSVYLDLTVAENLRYFASVVGARGSRVGDVVSQVALAGRERQVVGSMSGGERSRVSLAAALLGEPELLVLDEPTVGLDPVVRRELWSLFHSLADSGRTLLVSTHVMDEADRCTDLILMRDGAILATATPAKLRERTHSKTLEDAFIALAGA